MKVWLILQVRSVFDVNHEIEGPEDDRLGQAETRLYDATNALRTHVRQDTRYDSIVGEYINEDALLLENQIWIHCLVGRYSPMDKLKFFFSKKYLLKLYLDIDQHQDSLQNQGLLHKPVVDEEHILFSDIKKREETPHPTKEASKQHHCAPEVGPGRVQAAVIKISWNGEIDVF